MEDSMKMKNLKFVMPALPIFNRNCFRCSARKAEVYLLIFLSRFVDYCLFLCPAILSHLVFQLE